MKRLEVSGAVRPLQSSLGVKGLSSTNGAVGFGSTLNRLCSVVTTVLNYGFLCGSIDIKFVNQLAIEQMSTELGSCRATKQTNTNTHQTRYVEVQIQYSGHIITTCYTKHSITIRHHGSHSLKQPHTSRPTTPQ